MAQEVRFLVRQDPAVPAGGHALLYLQGARELPEGLRLVIRRRQPPEDYLGAAGWQSAPAEVAPEALRREGDGTPVIALGPAVVDRIKPHSKIEIAIPALGLAQTLVWPVLAQSPQGLLPTAGYVAGGSRPGKAAAGGIAPPKRRDPPPLQAPPEEPPLPEPEPTVEPPAPDPEPPAPLKVERGPQPPPPQKPRRRAWPWILLGLLLLAAAYLVLWQVRDRGPERLLCDWGLLDCVEEPCPAVAGESVRQRAECYLANLDPAEAFALAERLGESGEAGARDLAWAILDLLGERAYGPALLELGLCTDPLLKPECSLKPRLASNARQSLDYYRQAAAAGAPEAESLTAAVCQWLDGQSDLVSKATAATYCQ